MDPRPLTWHEGEGTPHTICVFNVNNLYARYRFGSTFSGDVAGKSAVNDPHWGYAPMYEPSAFELFGPEQRALAARAITRGGDRYPRRHPLGVRAEREERARVGQPVPSRR